MISSIQYDQLKQIQDSEDAIIDDKIKADYILAAADLPVAFETHDALYDVGTFLALFEHWELTGLNEAIKTGNYGTIYKNLTYLADDKHARVRV